MISYTSMGPHGEDLLPLRVTAGKISYLKEPQCGETLTSKDQGRKDLLHQRATVKISYQKGYCVENLYL